MIKKQLLPEVWSNINLSIKLSGVIRLLVMLIFILLCTPLAWANSSVNMKIYPAIGNYRKYKETLPLCVELTNFGPAFKGTIEVTSSLSYQRKKNLIFRKVNLPQYTPKQYFLYIPEFDTYNPYVSVELKAGKKIIAQTKITTDQIYPKDFLILAFSKEQSGLEYLTSQRLKPLFGRDAQIYLTYPVISHIPPTWIGYQSADMIVICNYPSLNFSQEQEKALRDWVLAGGILFISSSLSPLEFSQSALREIIPVGPPSASGFSLNDTIELRSLPELETFCNNSKIDLSAPVLMSEVENRKGTVLISVNQHPLLVKKNYARGAVYYFACDITKLPFNSWKGNIELWSKIYTDINFSRREKPSLGESTIYSNVPGISPPSLKNLSFFLFFYILVVGPVNYFLLRKKDWMLLSFITVPLIAILFTLSSFYYGYFTKGSNVLFQVFSFCEIKKNIPDAPVTSYFSLFSPRSGRYNIEINRSDAIVWELSPTENRDFNLEWQEKGGLLLENLEFDMWSMRGFKLEEILHYPGTIDYELSIEGNSIRGEIRNNLNLPLKNCSIICQHRVSPPIEIKKGKQEISLQLSKALSNQFEMSRYFVKLYQFDFDNKDIGKKREQMSIIRNITTSYFTRKDFNQPVIYGWSDKNISEIRLQKYRYKSENSALFIIE